MRRRFRPRAQKPRRSTRFRPLFPRASRFTRRIGAGRRLTHVFAVLVIFNDPRSLPLVSLTCTVEYISFSGEKIFQGASLGIRTLVVSADKKFGSVGPVKVVPVRQGHLLESEDHCTLFIEQVFIVGEKWPLKRERSNCGD